MVLNFNQSKARRRYFLASDWLKFGTFSKKCNQDVSFELLILRKKGAECCQYFPCMYEVLANDYQKISQFVGIK